MAGKYSLGNYKVTSGYDPFGTYDFHSPSVTSESSSFIDGSGLGFSLASGSSGGSNFMDSLNLGGDFKLDDYKFDSSLDFLNNGDTKPSFLDSLGGIDGITKVGGLASSMYSDYMQGKYLNAQMDALKSNMKMAKQANDTHYKNAAGFDNYSSSRTA